VRSISLVKINIVVYLLFVLFFAIGSTNIRIISYVQSLMTIAVVFVLGGMNIAALAQGISGKYFDALEYINVTIASGLLVVPLINLYGFVSSGYNEKLVLLISGLILPFNFLVHKFFFKNERKALFYPKFNFKLNKKSNLFFVFATFLVYLVVSGIIVTEFYNLPDLDPYVWLTRTNNCLAQGIQLSCFESRPLFETLNLLFTLVAKIDTYAYYKYVSPLLILLCFPPALLVSRTRKTFLGRIITVFLPLAVPSTLLYITTPMPQMVAIILAFYFFYWLIYSYETGSRAFYYLAGIVSLPIFWYHEVGAALLVFWSIVTIWTDRLAIVRFAKNKKIAITLTILLFAMNFPIFSEPLSFLKSWALVLSSHVGTKPNMLFPAVYTNIDGNNMGWSGFDGVFKYYLFYVGPLMLILLSLTFCFFVKKINIFQKMDKKTIPFIFYKLRKTPREIIILVSIFFFFFSISEIFPRLFGFAFLPERIWIFASISGFVFLFLTSRYWEKSIFWSSLFLCCIVVSISGAIYINKQKQYVLPEYKLVMSEWIKTNLPKDRIILSPGNKDLIRFHSQSDYYYLSREYYCNPKIRGVNDVWNLFETGIIPYVPTMESMEKKFKEEFADFLFKKEPINISNVSHLVNKYSYQNISVGRRLAKEDLTSLGFIYYYKEDEQNPYANRPYANNSTQCNEIVFDSHPESFQLVYNDKERVKIWKIIK